MNIIIGFRKKKYSSELTARSDRQTEMAEGSEGGGTLFRNVKKK
jgi:hypothetical protein